MDTLFTARSPLGYSVICTKNQWENHVIASHGIMTKKEHLVKNTISSPIAIYQSDEFPNRDVYFAHSGHNNNNIKYTKTIVEVKSNNSAEVVSAWLQPRISGNINPEVMKYVDLKL